jgi:hypothetical protein
MFSHFLLVCKTSLPLSLLSNTMTPLLNNNMQSVSNSADYDIIQQQLMAIRTEHSTNPLLASILARPPGQRLDHTDLVHILSTAVILSSDDSPPRRTDPSALDAGLALASQLDPASLMSRTTHL